MVPTRRDSSTSGDTSLVASRSASTADLDAASSASSGMKTSLGTKSDSTVLKTPMDKSRGRQTNDSDPVEEEEDDEKVEQETLDLLVNRITASCNTKCAAQRKWLMVSSSTS
jgi:hypothetical protein